MSPQRRRLVMDLIRGQRRRQRANRCASRRSARPSTSKKFAERHRQRRTQGGRRGAPLDVESCSEQTASSTKARAGSACVPRRWAARFATRRTAHSGSASPSITSPQRNACRYRSGSRSAKGCAWHARRSAQGSGRQAAKSKRRARSKSAGRPRWKETRVGQNNAPLRIPPRLQQAWKSAGTPTATTPIAARRVRLRRELKERLKSAGISSIDIERAQQARRAHLHRASGHHHRRKGAESTSCKAEAHQTRVHIDIQEVHRPELDAQLVANRSVAA